MNKPELLRIAKSMNEKQERFPEKIIFRLVNPLEKIHYNISPKLPHFALANMCLIAPCNKRVPKATANTAFLYLF